MAQPVITRETDDFAVDLTVVPLDGRIAADPLYEEEIDLLAQANRDVGRSSVSPSCASCNGLYQCNTSCMSTT